MYGFVYIVSMTMCVVYIVSRPNYMSVITVSQWTIDRALYLLTIVQEASYDVIRYAQNPVFFGFGQNVQMAAIGRLLWA